MKNLRMLRVALHFLLINGIFFLTYKLRLITDFIPGFQLPLPFINGQELTFFSLISSVIFLAIGVIKDFYPLNQRIINHFQKFSKVRMYWLISIAFLSYFGQGFIFFFGISRFIILISAFFSFLGILFFDQFRRKREYRLQQKSGKKILIIPQENLENPASLETIKQNFSLQTDFIDPKDLEQIDFQNYEMCVVLGMFPKATLQSLFEKTRMNATRFFHISEGFFLEDVVYTPEMIQNIIALEYKHSQLDGRSLVLKRIFDFFVSSIAIILLLPVRIVIAILIKMDSPGPVIYKSKRVWKGWKLITFLKFRTMYSHMSVGLGGEKADQLYQKLINSDANTREGILPKIQNDPRVTKIWAFLRKTSLDELPQLFCVWIGTMSLVGPRPHLQNEVNQYQAWEKRLLSIKPWITGYAQVFGRDSLAFEQEAQLDLYYIQNWSIWLDIYVIFATFGVIFKGR